VSGPKRVLVVEDEAKLAGVLQDYLRAAGFDVAWLARGNEVVPWLRANGADLLLLDVMLPGMDGLEVCRAVRAFSGVPILFVTARVEEVDRLLGLDSGADDYICKPFSPREVVARVKAVLRRPPLTEAPGGRLLVGPFALDEARRHLDVDGAAVELTGSEFRLLQTLVRAPGRVFSRAHLLDLLHGDGEGDANERSIDTHVKNLRRKLGPHGVRLRSVYGAGYQLEP
jgi:two-component system response regulator BaeR